MKGITENILIAAAILFVFVAIPFAHDHPHTLFDPTCPAHIIQISMLAYTIFFLNSNLFTIFRFQFFGENFTPHFSPRDIYQLFINKAPPRSSALISIQ